MRCARGAALEFVEAEGAFADRRVWHIGECRWRVAVDDEHLFTFAAGEGNLSDAEQENDGLDRGGPLVACLEVVAEGRAGKQDFDLASGKGAVVLHGADDEAIAGPGERHHDKDDAALHKREAGILPQKTNRDQDDDAAPQTGAVQGEQARADEGAEVRLLAEQLEGVWRDDGAEEENAADPRGECQRAKGSEQGLHVFQFRLAALSCLFGRCVAV